MSTENNDDTTNDRRKSLPFLHRNYLLLKGHYFLSYCTFASLGPILSLILRGRGFTDAEISYINLCIPFLVFFTNPLLGFLADRGRHFRLTFNISLAIATILFIIMFFLPSIKFNHIQGEIHRTNPMKYSLDFDASKDFARKCALRAQCGCIYQANCTKHHLNGDELMETFHLNLTMNSRHVKQENRSISSRKIKPLTYLIKYHIPVQDEIKGIQKIIFTFCI
jgi:hypothetical protein